MARNPERERGRFGGLLPNRRPPGKPDRRGVQVPDARLARGPRGRASSSASSVFDMLALPYRNWIEWGKLPALRVGRRFLVRREHIQELLDQAQAADGAHATGRDVWDPTVSRLVPRRTAPASTSVWDNDAVATSTLPLKQP
jgi:hypothetical protein